MNDELLVFVPLERKRAHHTIRGFTRHWSQTVNVSDAVLGRDLIGLEHISVLFLYTTSISSLLRTVQHLSYLFTSNTNEFKKSHWYLPVLAPLKFTNTAGTLSGARTDRQPRTDRQLLLGSSQSTGCLETPLKAIGILLQMIFWSV